MEAKQAALMEQAAVEAAAKAAREAAELSAQKKKVMLMKAELAREAAEADDAEASWQAMEASRVAVAESLESARSSLAPLRADMETKMMFFSQVAADAEVATEEQAESIIKQKATMLKADDLESEAVMLNQNATDFPNPDNEKLALEAVKQHEAAKIEREEALEHVKKVIAECEKLTAEKSESYQSASNSKELFEQASTEVLEVSPVHGGVTPSIGSRCIGRAPLRLPSASPLCIDIRIDEDMPEMHCCCRLVNHTCWILFICVPL